MYQQVKSTLMQNLINNESVFILKVKANNAMRMGTSTFTDWNDLFA